jgi:hypothetical protein
LTCDPIPDSKTSKLLKWRLRRAWPAEEIGGKFFPIPTAFIHLIHSLILHVENRLYLGDLIYIPPRFPTGSRNISKAAVAHDGTTVGKAG